MKRGKQMKKILAMVLGAFLFAFGCGEQPSDEVTSDANGETVEIAETEEYVLPEADVYITVSDSIGIELGDSNYVFGQIAGADVLQDGRIAILDLQKNSISLFSQSGEFLQRIGRQGSGPGEFLFPIGMAFFWMPEGIDTAEDAVTDSPVPGLVVSDAMGGKLVYFDSNLEYMMDAQGFYPSPPAVIAAVDNGAIVGMKPEFDQNEEGMFMGFTIGRWELGETEPSVVYFQSMSPFDPTDLSSMQDDILSFAASPEGLVLTAPLSSDLYQFTAWSQDGEELFVVTDEDFARVPKTQEEIDLEAEVVNNRMIQQGMPPDMARWEPDPYRMAIAGLWFDDYDRIWVTRGTTRTGSFNVYDLEGNFLFLAAVDAGERARNWQIMIEKHQFLAFDADPEFYPLVFIGDLPGNI